MIDVKHFGDSGAWETVASFAGEDAAVWWVEQSPHAVKYQGMIQLFKDGESMGDGYRFF